MLPETLATWTAAFNEMAEGLNFDDSEDRVTFRSRVDDRTKNTTVNLIKKLAREIAGRDARTTSRARATRALADGFIAKRRGILPAEPRS